MNLYLDTSAELVINLYLDPSAELVINLYLDPSAELVAGISNSFPGFLASIIAFCFWIRISIGRS